MKKLGLSVFFILLFFVSDPNFHSVDKRIYTHYTVSLIEDLDLNVVNQIPEKEAWLLTSTKNYPDVHSNGISVLWAPFFASTWMLSPFSSLSQEVLYRNVQTLANLFWGLLALVMLWSWLRRYYSESITMTTLGLLLLVSPFYWNWIYQPENADVTSLFLSTALLHFYSERRRFNPHLFCFLFGAFLLAAGAMKFDLIFYGLLLAHFFYENRKSSWLSLFFHAFCFAMGALPLLTLASVNESLKAGFPDNSYMNTVAGNIYVLYENLFAPSGYFRTQPFWLILILMFLFLIIARKKRAPSLVFFLFAIPLTEIALESFNYNHNESFSSRHWINDLPCWAAVLATTLRWLEGSIWKKILIGAGFVGGLFTIAGSLVYRLDFDAYYFTGQWLSALSNLQFSDLLYFVKPKDIDVKLAILPLAFLAVGLFFLFSKVALRQSNARLSTLIFVTFAILYGATTMANILNNHKSAAAVPERVSQAVIGHGPHINSFFENAGCLQRAVEYYGRRGQPEKAEHRQRILEDYVQRAGQEITRDPIGLKSILRPGYKHYVPEHLWSDE